MTERAMIIDRPLATLRAIRSNQLGAAILAMGKWQRLPIFASPKPTSARSSLDRGNRGVAEDNFCGLVRHRGRDYEKNARCVYRRKNRPAVPIAPIATRTAPFLAK